MSIKKRLTSFVTCAALIAAIIPSTVSAHDGEYKIYKGSFVYKDATAKSNSSGEFYYTDAYFTRPSTTMDEHLRTMSLCLALASKKSSDKGNLYDILKSTGFDKNTIVSYDLEDQTKDTVGTVIANKTTESGDKLVVVVLNGMLYGQEWENNLIVGSSGDAEGMSASAKKVYDRILKYEKDNSLKGAKLWIAGYSRGAGIADLTGKMINQNLSEFGIKDTDLYDYTFAAPRVSATANGYKNIQNAIDPYDPITKLMPQGWGIERAGTEFVIPCEKQTIQPKELSFSGGIKIVDKAADPIAMDTFLDNFSKLLSDNVSRADYDAQKTIIPLFITKLINDENEYNLTTFLIDTFKGIDTSSPLFLSLITLLALPVDSTDYNTAMDALAAQISALLDASPSKDKISAEDLELTKKSLPALVKVFMPAVQKDLPNVFETICTLIGNIKQITTYHFASNYYNKLTAIDSYYTKGTVDPGKFYYFKKTEEKGDADKIRSLGGTDEDIRLIKNGYDVEYRMKYDVIEEKDVSDADKKAIESVIGAKPDLAIYCKNSITRKQTFEDAQTIQLSGSFDVTFRCIPGEDEELFTKGKYFFVTYENGKAELVPATFTFNENGELVTAYKNTKRGYYALVYLETNEKQAPTASSDTPPETGVNPDKLPGGIMLASLAAFAIGSVAVKKKKDRS